MFQTFPGRKIAQLLFITAIRVLQTAAFSEAQPNLAQRMGYPADSKLVILHIDDLGETHSVNAASIQALEAKRVNSASIMVPCPWFPEIAAYARRHPEMDWGVHLTLTSERTDYRWGPVASKDKVPSLLDSDGYFYKDPATAAAKIDPKEAEIEIRAQIERAKASGIPFTHVDSHQLMLYTNRPLTEVLFKVAREYKIPVTQAVTSEENIRIISSVLKPGDVSIDRTITIEPSVSPDHWQEFYMSGLKNLKPGVTALVMHLAHDDDEMRAFSSDRPTWGAAWRQRDFDVVMGESFRQALKDNGIILITWRDIRDRLLGKQGAQL